MIIARKATDNFLRESPGLPSKDKRELIHGLRIQPHAQKAKSAHCPPLIDERSHKKHNTVLCCTILFVLTVKGYLLSLMRDLDATAVTGMKKMEPFEKKH